LVSVYFLIVFDRVLIRLYLYFVFAFIERRLPPVAVGDGEDRLHDREKQPKYRFHHGVCVCEEDEDEFPCAAVVEARGESISLTNALVINSLRSGLLFGT
jgi:hypothetical protein